MAVINILGQKFNRLTARSRKGSYHWCDCECGNRAFVRTDKLKAGRVKSCGCFKEDYVRSVTTRTSRDGTKLYTPADPVRDRLRPRWASMMKRCYDETNHAYPRYGGRGITVCERWHSLDNFVADMREGFQQDLMLERVDNDAGYAPENCRWAAPVDQARNRSNNLPVLCPDKITRCLKDVAERMGVGYQRATKAYHKAKAHRGQDHIPTTRDLVVCMMTVEALRRSVFANPTKVALDWNPLEFDGSLPEKCQPRGATVLDDEKDALVASRCAALPA